MSSAFRNFVLTFLLALIVFGLVAWRVLPAAEAALLGTDPAEESSDTSDTASGGELSEDPNVQPVDPEKEGMVHLTGMALLMTLMVFILFNDISNLFLS